MVNHPMVHEDDEPLLPLMEYDNGRSKNSSRTPHEDIVKTSKLSESTVHDSISSSSSGHEGTDRHHHHKQHAHDDLTKRLSASTEYDHVCRPSTSDDECDSSDDGSMLLEAKRQSERDKQRLKIAIGLCSTFFVVELLGGLWADSLALLSDSFHLLTDITSFVISLAAIYLSQRPSTATHTFGYHRAEVLGALCSIFLIWGLTFMLVVEAYDRVRHPIDVDGKTMSVVAGLGVFVNIILMFVLGGHHHHHGHDHEHGHSHQDGSDHALTHKPVPLHEHHHDHDHGRAHSGHGHNHHHINLNITAATLHVLGDLISSIGVLISSLVITFHPNLTFLDPVCTFVFSAMVIATTVGVFKQSVSILMERVPYGMDSEEIKEAICDIPGILEVKSLNVWSLTIGQVALAGSVYVQPEIKDLKKAAAIVTKARKMLKNRYGIKECTIQVEIYTPNAESSHQRRSDSTTILSSVSTASTRVSTHGGKGIGESRHSIDALARHDKDIIFSIGEDELEETLSPHPTRTSSGHLHTPHLIPNEIIRAGTPLSQYRENRHTSEDDESESEMDQETPLRSEPSHWV